MQQRTLIVAIDLGTTATTASHIFVNDSFTTDGILHREKGRVKVTNIKDWPGGNNGDATGNVCVPTDLIYTKADRKLLYWGFRAQQYLDDPFPNIERDTVFVVEHIKLLLLDSDHMLASTTASQRYREQRSRLTATLGKQPEEVFEDFLNEAIAHIIGSAHRKYFNGISSSKIELVLAFPSGWPDFLHTRVSRIGARAMAKAISALNLQNMIFGIENVYTVSETLCGVKEWLRDTLAEATTSVDLDFLGTNLNELNEGDCFLPVDIGGGTGCMTPLKLVTKEPLRVDQLGPTQSLQISGEAVEAEFESWLRPQISSDDYPEDIPELIYQICRKFKEEKKDCGLPPRPGSTTWNISAPRLQANPEKGFGKGYMKIERRQMERCFDPVIDALEIAIDEMLRKMEGIKTIIFLGQFGSSSEYLRKRMAASHISGRVKMRHSDSGKLNVVKGAISERLELSETFVRKSQTLKSYGTLVTLKYYPGSGAALLFPDARKHGAVPLERDAEGEWLKVVEWAIPKGTILEDGEICDTTGNDARRHHTWPQTKGERIEFEDSIIVSDEVPPAPQLEGKSYTLWTEAHEKNQLVVNGQKKQVQQIKFSWDLSMSEKLDAAGNNLGAYEETDLETYWFPEEYRKGKRRLRLRRLYYQLIWNITEMQVKVHVQPLFPKPPGPLTTQLAKECPFEAHEKSYTGESRSRALERDILISEAGISKPSKDIAASPFPQHGNIGIEHDSEQGAVSLHVEEGTIAQSPQVQRDSNAVPRTTLEPKKVTVKLNLTPQNRSQESIFTSSTSDAPRTMQESASNSPKKDRRQKEGCFTCKSRKKRCKPPYMINHTTGVTSCTACIKYQIDCHMTPPAWSEAQLKAKQLEWKGRVRLGKRKFREESDLSNTAPRSLPTTINPAKLTLDAGLDAGFDTGTIQRTIAPIAPMGQ